MVLNKTSKYLKNCRKIKDKHQFILLSEIERIENLLIFVKNFSELIRSPFYKVYNFEMLRGDLQGYYSARLSGGCRLIIKPCGNEPYKFVEIEEINMEEINIKHYK